MSLDLEAIKARAERATPGPWVIERSEWTGRLDVATASVDLTPGASFGPTHPGVAERVEEQDATFIAHARADVPALVLEVETLRLALQELQALPTVRRTEQEFDEDDYCSDCVEYNSGEANLSLYADGCVEAACGFSPDSRALYALAAVALAAARDAAEREGHINGAQAKARALGGAVAVHVTDEFGTHVEIRDSKGRPVVVMHPEEFESLSLEKAAEASYVWKEAPQ